MKPSQMVVNQIDRESNRTDAAGGISRRGFFRYTGLAAGALALGSVLSSCSRAKSAGEAAGAGTAPGKPAPTAQPPALPKLKRVAADPVKIPPPITRRHPEEVSVTLEAREVLAEIEDGTLFHYMTFNGQVPGPMIRVREGDTVNLTFRNPKDNLLPHNVDFHAVAGPGGGAAADMAAPGQQAHLRFKVTYPGAFIYHCAVPNFDEHISAGMFGMILVEPREGLPKVDHEFYLGQNEIYVKDTAGAGGYHEFDSTAMLAEDPAYVVLNGRAYGLMKGRYGAMQVKTGESARVYFVTGGPNLTSSFHAIGNVWKEVWPQGSLRSEPLRYIQTQPVPPGSTMIATLDFPVPGDFKLLDHAVTRAIHKGCLAIIHAEGPENPELFAPGKTVPIKG